MVAGRVGRGLLASPAGRRLVDAGVIEDGEEVLDEQVQGDIARGIEFAPGQAEPAHVRPNDPEMAREMGNPSIPEPGGAPIAMLQDEKGALFPGIGEIVQLVVECQVGAALD